eukprot:163206-Chlamydomonas_euryale.AAC.15
MPFTVYPENSLHTPERQEHTMHPHLAKCSAQDYLNKHYLASSGCDQESTLPGQRMNTFAHLHNIHCQQCKKLFPTT